MKLDFSEQFVQITSRKFALQCHPAIATQQALAADRFAHEIVAFLTRAPARLLSRSIGAAAEAQSVSRQLIYPVSSTQGILLVSQSYQGQ